MGEGGANLAMTIGSAALIEAKVVKAPAGLAGGAATLGAGLLAAGGIMLAAEEAKDVDGAKTAAVEATEFVPANTVVEGEEQGGVRGALEQAGDGRGGSSLRL